MDPIKTNIFLCDNPDCSCHSILNDKKKLDEIIIKKEKYYCFNYYLKTIKKK